MDFDIEIIEDFYNGTPLFSICIKTAEKEYNYCGITENKDEAEALCVQLKSGDVSSIHFDDIVHDFIMGKAYDKLIVNNI